jgi:hypothetical protein
VRWILARLPRAPSQPGGELLVRVLGGDYTDDEKTIELQHATVAHETRCACHTAM